jgi:hypothetical protein
MLLGSRFLFVGQTGRRFRNSLDRRTSRLAGGRPVGDRPSGGAALSCWANSRYGSAAGAGRWAGSGILARAGLFRRIAERLADQCTSPAHPSDSGFGVVAKLLCDPSGTALAAEFTDGRGDGMLHLSSAGIIRALQGRHEEGVGPQGANTRMLHR